jgi:hypothetical protein
MNEERKKLPTDAKVFIKCHFPLEMPMKSLLNRYTSINHTTGSAQLKGIMRKTQGSEGQICQKNYWQLYQGNWSIILEKLLLCKGKWLKE